MIVQSRLAAIAALTLFLGATALFACSADAEPSFEELRRTVKPIAREVGLTDPVERMARGGQSLGVDSETTATISGSVTGEPAAMLSAIHSALKENGFVRIRGLDPTNRLASSWKREAIQVDVNVDGTVGAGVQSLVVSLSAVRD